MSQSRESQLAWLEQALARTGLSVNALAELARVNPATLYRFQNGQSDQLRAVTINRLARAARMEPPEFSGLSERDAREFAMDMIPKLAAPPTDEPNLFAVKVLNDAMSAAGIAPGDILVFDRTLAAKAGDIVCAQVYDFRLGDAETAIRYFEPPYLVAAGDDPRWRKPILIDKDVLVTGVIIRQIRVRDFEPHAA